MTALVVAAAWLLAGCVTDGETLGSTAGESFEDFKAHTYREPFANKLYVVDGDTPVLNDKRLYEFWEGLQQGGLSVNTIGGHDDRWNDQQKLELTYCVSNNFGSNKAAIVSALADAAQGWTDRANVKFVYVPAEDARCTTSNTTVLFDVRQVSGQPYLARSFFPSSSRPERELLVDTSSLVPTLTWPLDHILGHELGHVLGFRHEHTRPEAGTCFEDNNWRALTPYDSASIMHYPQCNGSSQDLNWTASDARGAAMIYGAPGSGGSGSGGTGTGTGTAKTTSTPSRALEANAEDLWDPYAVVAGSTFEVTMTGTGDPDLYVRWGSEPTLTAFNCRPYVQGSDETCSISVPAGQTKAYVMVHGFAASTYSLDISWTSP
jgi:hypothetical protein